MNSEINTIRLAGIVRESIVDGPGIRFVVFCQGCPHKCPGCHNGVTHDFAGGYDCEISRILDAVDSNPLLKGVTFSGGEPTCQPEAFAALGKELKKRNLDIIMYSGYTFEELLEMSKSNKSLKELLYVVDTLIDGRYIEAERDLSLLFRGSRNQRILDLPESLKKERAVIREEF